ncbi:hypothetical protein H920_18977 [Fukomys damarensis]|uniref:Uncharacterized protein n=1 Tax=Fukomys damarensis TaxID=885580 RepID=A0A091DA36_FUKDA|nr:hypothetical protein H920_18977 [Fukomys damarensis]
MYDLFNETTMKRISQRLLYLAGKFPNATALMNQSLGSTQHHHFPNSSPPIIIIIIINAFSNFQSRQTEKRRGGGGEEGKEEEEGRKKRREEKRRNYDEADSVFRPENRAGAPEVLVGCTLPGGIHAIFSAKDLLRRALPCWCRCRHLQCRKEERAPRTPPPTFPLAILDLLIVPVSGPTL